MSLPAIPPTFRPDRPQIELSGQALTSALAHAESGYPVIPVVYDPRSKSKRPPRPGMKKGSRDPKQIRAWWKSHPSAQVGIVLDGLGMVVADVDGPLGEQWLTDFAERAGLALPSTYEYTTGRGRHLWFRIPVWGCRDLHSQQGGQHNRPKLDFKMTWLLVVPGSVHRSGAAYVANWDHIPVIEELPYLPDALWTEIEASAKSRRRSSGSKPEVRSGAPSSSLSDLDAGTVVRLEGGVGRRLDRDLHDVSDGRDPRVFSVVLLMLRFGVSEPDVRATLLASPLGDKVREQRDPVTYLSHKVVSAQEMVDSEDRDWDARLWWSAVVSAGLSDSQVRVLHYLLSRANRHGIVSRSVGKVGLGSAMTEGSASAAMTSLGETGWLTVLRDFDPKTMTPKTYRLDLPTCAHSVGAVSMAPAPSHPDDVCPQKMRGYTGHDAFRPRPGLGGRHTLHGSYRVLLLLNSVPITTTDLSHSLHCSEPQVRRHMAHLRQAGLAIKDTAGHRVTNAPLGPLLAEAAQRSKTAGTRDRQHQQYVADRERNRALREAMGTPGTPEWRAVQIRDCRRWFDEPHWKAAADRWLAVGRSLDDLAEDLVRGMEDRLLNTYLVFEGWTEEVSRR